MTGSDERLARVSYLPGVPRPSDPVGADALNDLGECGAPRDHRGFAGGQLDECIDVEIDLGYQQAVKLLARRDHSIREIEHALRAHGRGEEAIGFVIEKLRGNGYLDDSAAAQTLVARLQERKGYGRQAIAAELARRMFAPAAIEYALELVDSGEELVRCRDLAINRARSLDGLPREVAERRLVGYLQRRGYSGSTVRSAVDAALAPVSRPTSVRFR